MAGSLLLSAGPFTDSASQANEPKTCQMPDGLHEQATRIVEARDLPMDDSTSCALIGAKVKLPSGALMTVPRPGDTVTLSAMTAAGYEETPEIIAYTSAEGTLAVMEKYSDGRETIHGSRKLESKLKKKDIDENPFASTGTGIPTVVTNTKCAYNKININPKSWTDVAYIWKLTSSASYPLPGPLQVVEANLTQPSGVWENRGTDCNVSYPITKLDSIYGGTTSSIASVNSDQTCGLLPDHRNTVTFKPINDPGKLAYACTYADATRIYDADIAFDSSNRNWALNQNGSSLCSGDTYVLGGVAAHEFGHAYGMAHAGQYQETEQVMRPEIGTCQWSDYSLGAGDLASLYAHYHF